MSQLMQLQTENERTFLTFQYRRIQDIDDVILQLLNEADIDGFVRSYINKAASTVNYEVTGYRKWTEISSDQLSPERMAAFMENLYQLLAYLEDSFIDVEYVLLDTSYLYVDPGTDRLQLLVLPCQKAVDQEYTLADCVSRMFASFAYGEDVASQQLKTFVSQELQDLNDLNTLAQMLREVQNLSSDADLSDAHQEEDVIAEEVPAGEIEAVEDIEAGEEEIESAEVLSADEATELEAIEPETVPQTDPEISREQLREELRQELTEELTEKIRSELRESIRAEIEEEQAAAAENADKMPYLIRKKTGEIICLNRQTFLIGKLENCCDYVIRGNKAISRLHAVIKYNEETDTYVIIDCNSTNHIYLNGRQIEAEQPVPLEEGMHIHLALEEFVFQVQ